VLCSGSWDEVKHWVEEPRKPTATLSEFMVRSSPAKV
jgi:hypothetical protein